MTTHTIVIDSVRITLHNRNSAHTYMWINAEADVKYLDFAGSYRLETLTSGGLHGINRDATKDFLNEIGKDELDDLKNHLAIFGVSLENWKERTEHLEIQ